ncbi:MAG TPA: patatin-like phospholipase family protein, partial [Candidatus Cloacimonadota bacterium]|nr:patatin-like phospholipase family protein [Candidatus Cloacimonadota bacterium]
MRRFIYIIVFWMLVLPLFARPKIGLVLSGGGAKGLAHIGMLKVIEEAGLPIDCIVGTSMGAIIGGLYAMGYSADQIEAEIRKIDWDAMLTNDVPREDFYVSEKRWKPMSNYYFNLSPGFKPS